MKRYIEYMESVEVSPELHEKLTGLAAPKRTAAWKKFGAIAAALALVVGVGAWSLSRLPGMDTPAIGTAEIAIDIAPVEPGEDVAGDGMKTIGGYEVVDGEMAAYYILPYIAYGDAGSSPAESTADFALNAPEGSVQRDVTGEDITALVGGQEALAVHLNWQDFQWSGSVALCPDGTVWHLAAWGEKDDMACSLELLAGDKLPPTCVLTLPETVTDVWGVEVVGRTGGIYGRGENREVWMPESREVEFVANGAGFRFELYGLEGESEAVETMVSRFVRYAVLEGLDLSALPLNAAE